MHYCSSKFAIKIATTGHECNSTNIKGMEWCEYVYMGWYCYFFILKQFKFVRVHMFRRKSSPVYEDRSVQECVLCLKSTVLTGWGKKRFPILALEACMLQNL